jgi:hypothetical protein
MYEVTMQELSVFVALGFAAGLFVSIWLARVLEVIHTWRLLEETVLHILLMLLQIAEDVSFVQAIKKKHMVHQNMSLMQIRDLEQFDNKTLTNWKESVIMGIVNKAPPHFRSMLPFTDWDSAMRYMNKALKERV